VAAVLDDVSTREPLAVRVEARVHRDIEDAAVRLSPGLLHVVLANLLGNAFKFLEGRQTRWVRVVASRRGDHFEIVVEDSGPGIPHEAIEHVFEPFYRAPGVKASGSGIGLATVRRVVDAHDGRIAVSPRSAWARWISSCSPGTMTRS
jgi:signal transduction histidine kinase